MDEPQPQRLPPAEPPPSISDAKPQPEPPPAIAAVKPPLREYLYRFNMADIAGLVAIILTVLSLVACIPGLNYALYLLPVVALGFGIAALVLWRRAVNPERARLSGGISVGVTALLLVLVLACCCVCAVFYGLAFAGSMAGGGSSTYRG